MRKPATLLHRLLALLLLLGVLAVAALFVVKPIRDRLADMDRQIAEDARMIQRLRAGSDSIETYSDAIAALETALRADPRFLSADSTALASAALQQIIRRRLQDAGATLRSVQEVPADRRVSGNDTVRAPTPVTVRATVMATYPDFLAAIGQIEVATPYLFIDQLSIGTPLRTEPATEWPPLTIRFDVTAFMPPTVSMPQ